MIGEDEMKSLREYQHVIWDWNGTLLDDLWLCMEIINGMLRKRQLPELDRGAYQGIFGFPIRGYYEKAGFDFKEEPFERLSDEYISQYDARSRECPLQVGAKELVVFLTEKGLSQTILSASQESVLRTVVKDYGIEPYFMEITGLDNSHAAGKIELGKAWLERQEKEKGKILFIGDTEHDFETASAMGIDCVLISDGHQSKERLEACGVPVYSSLLQLKEAFQRAWA